MVLFRKWTYEFKPAKTKRFMQPTKNSGIYLPGMHVLLTFIVFTNEFSNLSMSTDEG